ncbi:MAG TPA: hypothetical protein VFI37_12800 [Gaiellaceae bacterium]|jgi:hypothetical protein|nr:hypothetical protein [Gaiellaceae bacterium]
MVAEDLTTLLDEIESLLREPSAGGAAAVARIEQTLTDGYARALALEGRRWRLERQITDVGRLLAGGDENRAAELTALYGRLSETEADLSKLRGALAELRRHANAVRAA